MTDFTFLRIDVELSYCEELDICKDWQLFYVGNLAHEFITFLLYLLLFFVWIFVRVERKIKWVHVEWSESVCYHR